MSDRAVRVAEILLDIKAAHFYENEPFVFTSATLSPVYVDCRKLISFPSDREQVIACFRDIVLTELGGQKIDVVAGGETAGIPYAAWLAQVLNLPMIYVRKSPKGFGRQAQIEGYLPEGASVILIEDLLFDAQSKINFCLALRQAGAKVQDTLVLFDYGNRAAREKLKAHDIRLHCLTDWPALLSAGEKSGYFSPSQAIVIKEFLADPRKWSESRSGALGG